MSRLARTILKHVPIRRRRHWRYISPHRRGASVALLALLVVGVCGYVYLPPLLNEWTRRLAAGYLRDFTGGRVVIESARFSIFGDIELNGVRIDVPTSISAERFFQADTVVVRHRPWSLLRGQRLEPTELVCIGPSVRLGYDVQKGRYTWQELLAAARLHRGTGAASVGRLPIVSIRNIHLRLLTGQTQLSLSMTPKDGRKYLVEFEEQPSGGKRPVRGQLMINLATGQPELVGGQGPIANIDGVLPEKYRKWRQDYNLTGDVVLKGLPASAPGGRSRLSADLADVSLTLRKDEGGMDLDGVHGTLIFDEKGVTVDKMEGRIPQAGGAAFRMDGRYEGFEKDSAFHLTASIRGLRLPEGGVEAEWLKEVLAFLNESFRPEGQVDIEVVIARPAGGKIAVDGTARPKGVTATYAHFPYRLEGVTGAVHFTTDEVRLKDIRGGHGPAEVTVNGRVDLRKSHCYDVTVEGRNVPLGADVRSALAKEHAAVWDDFDPRGFAGTTFHVWRGEQDKHFQTHVTLRMDGKTSAAYVGFPYRMDELTGEVGIADGLVTVTSMRGRRGPTKCTVDGTVAVGADAKGETNLTIEATDVPLDANLIAAMPPGTREPTASLRPAGTVEHVTARLRGPAGRPGELTVVTRVRKASFRPEVFPYDVTDAAGVVTIHPRRVVIEDIVGRHGGSTIHVSGQVMEGKKTPALDLHIRAEDVQVDRELYSALPKDVQATWRRLAPSGLADLDLTFQRDMPGHEPRTDYTLSVEARGLQIRYEDYPYTLRGVRGQAVVTPGRIVLKGLTATDGPATLVFGGEITFDDSVERAKLSVRGRSVLVDKEFIAAMPDFLVPLGRHFRPGGTCDIDLKSFQIARWLTADGDPASRPATAPATRPAQPGPVTWSMEGRAAFHDAIIDIGLGQKTFTGRVDGTAAEAPRGAAIDAAIEFDSVLVAKQRLTKLRGRLIKGPASTMLTVKDLTAETHGGRISGFAEIRLVDPLEYGISLSVENIKLEDLSGSRLPEALGKTKVEGLLDGRIQLTAVAGAKPTRQASGVLRISEAKLYKLPVLLGLLHVVYLTLPGESAFTEGHITYHLRNDMLIFDEIHLRGSALSIVGSGTMDMRTEALRLTFLGGPPRALPRIGSLHELLEGIVREIAEIHVTGTLSKPNMRTVPLRSLDAAIQVLMNPSRAKP